MSFIQHLPNLQRLVVCVTCLVWVAFARVASAGGCADPTANVGCSVAECIALQAAVDGTKGAPSCKNVSGCTPLRSARQQWLDHYTARSIINGRCYAGGDIGHQIAAANAIEHVGKCDARIALPQPVGCEDPCPGAE